MQRAVQLVPMSNIAIRRFAKLGVLPSDVEHVGTSMFEAGASAHPLGAKSEAGNQRYSRGIAAWAEVLLERGWSRECIDGCEMITSPDRTICFVVVSGDGNVGMMQAPKPRYPRGRAIQGRIAMNAHQLGLDEILGQPRVVSKAPKMWITLHHVANGRLYLEVSLPARIEGSRSIEWQERIPAGVYGFPGEDPFASEGLSDGPLPSGPQITIRPK